MKQLITDSRWWGIILVLAMAVSTHNLFAQEEELEELPESKQPVRCEPDSVNVPYFKWKSDSITQEQVNIWYSFAQEKYKYKDYKGAIPYFWRVLMNYKNPQFKVVYNKLADCYFRLGAIDSTLLVAYMGLKKYPSYDNLHWWVATLQNRLGHTECAIPHYEALVKTNPKKKEYWERLAQLYFSLGDERALEAQKKVVELDPNDVEASQLYAEMIRQFGGDPLQALKETFEKDTTNIENAFRYGKEAYNSGEYQQAVRAFKSILAQDPKHQEAMEYLGRSYEGLSRYREAIVTYKRILEQDPKNINVLCLLARVYIQQNSFSAALTYARRARNIDPSNGLPHIIIAEVYEAAVNYCSNKRAKHEFTYDDKLVYRMARNEYLKAAKDPNWAADASRRARQLQTLLPTKEDLFMHKNRLKPTDSCYQSIL